ncbi:hypothetical protein RIR_jg29693.t1 [Rhizophagus irregularis DAOM 181602=DAOM 197198]|nr:hypothetical protein RIR_jg29693.t1 [Rhizophagus irregularis DAOM 181602=DAOM 197198]
MKSPETLYNYGLDINRLIIFLDYNIVELEYCTRVLFNEEKWFKIEPLGYKVELEYRAKNDGDGDVIDGIYSEERRYEEKEGIRGESKT